MNWLIDWVIDWTSLNIVRSIFVRSHPPLKWLIPVCSESCLRGYHIMHQWRGQAQVCAMRVGLTIRVKNVLAPANEVSEDIGTMPSLRARAVPSSGAVFDGDRPPSD